jgi:hypothetical protein
VGLEERCSWFTLTPCGQGALPSRGDEGTHGIGRALTLSGCLIVGLIEVVGLEYVHGLVTILHG